MRKFKFLKVEATFIKYVVTFMILISVFFLGSVAITYSQPPSPPTECTTPCSPYSPWIYESDVTQLPEPLRNYCPSCIMFYEYWWRVCNDEIEIILGRVEYHGDCAQNPGCAVFPFVHYAAALAAKSNPPMVDTLISNCDPNGIYCKTEVKLSMVNCYQWQQGQGPLGPNDIYWYTVPCPNETCCEYELEVCIVDCDPEQIMSAIQSVYSPANCAQNCFNACADWGESLKSIQMMESDYHNDRIKLIPNPSNGEFTIDFGNANTGNYKFVITDLRGNKVFEDIISVASNNYQIDVKLDNLQNGTYFFSFIFDNVTYSNGKIIISK